MARNPKDVIVSFFYHHQLMELHKFTGDVEKFAQYFMDDEGKACALLFPTYHYLTSPFFVVMFSPFFAHILDAWSKRHHPNMLFLFYEDMKKVFVSTAITQALSVILSLCKTGSTRRN